MSTSSTELQVVDDPARVAADRIAEVVEAGGQVVLTGGETPRAAYEALAGFGLDWSRCTLWFGDERCVPPEDELSNFGMVRDSLLRRIGGAAPTVRRMAGELGPADGAATYERDLEAAFGAGPPRFDLVLLGMGPDGHCASLFPGQPTLEERERSVVGVQRAGLEPFVPRVTLTLPAINAAREVLFLIGGERKAQAVARAFTAPPSREVPASLVAPASGPARVLLDPAAASAIAT